MDFELEGRKYNLCKDPTLAAVENVMVFDELLRISFIDYSILKPEDLEKSPDMVLQEQGKKNPRILAEYTAKVKMSEVIKTVMLCTGLSEKELQDAPLKPVFEKSIKLMGGTASDFFLDFNKITQESATLTLTRHPDYAKSLQDLMAKTGKSNVSGSPKESKPEIATSGISG